MPLWRVTLPPSPLLISKLSYLFIYLNLDLCLSAASVFPKHISKPTPHEQKKKTFPPRFPVMWGTGATWAWSPTGWPRRWLCLEEGRTSMNSHWERHVVWLSPPLFRDHLKYKVEMHLLWNICVPYMCLSQTCMLKLVSLSQNLRINYVNYAY